MLGPVPKPVFDSMWPWWQTGIEQTGYFYRFLMFISVLLFVIGQVQNRFQGSRRPGWQNRPKCYGRLVNSEKNERKMTGKFVNVSKFRQISIFNQVDASIWREKLPMKDQFLRQKLKIFVKSQDVVSCWRYWIVNIGKRGDASIWREKLATKKPARFYY